MNRLDDVRRFYSILEEVRQRVGGPRVLSECSAKTGWPKHGVYFFFETGEQRSDSGDGPRVVRVGTHALTATSKATLWGRLSAHKGSTKTGGGSHRASILRLLVGAALCRRDGRSAPKSWTVGSHPGEAAAKLNLDKAHVLPDEHSLEVEVSNYVGAMPFLWLPVDGAEARAAIECSAIGLLSNLVGPSIDAPSEAWLGRFSDHEVVRSSGLWNVRCVDTPHSSITFDELVQPVQRL